MESKKVILVHGFFKGRRDMDVLEKGLREAGFFPYTVDLPTTFGSLEECCNSMHIQIQEIACNSECLHYVAHSMGGLIVREYLRRYSQLQTGHCIFIATPHKGTKAAITSSKIPFYEEIFKPIKSLKKYYEAQSLGSTIKGKIGIISGTKNQDIIGKIFSEPESDGRVEIASTFSKDMEGLLKLPYQHKDIHRNKETLNAVINFLKHGHFGTAY